MKAMRNTLGTTIQWTPDQTLTRTPWRNERCERCGVSLASERLSLREALLNIVCGCLWLSVAGWSHSSQLLYRRMD
jgi:hypothetical protein